jgi:hypothetical protein
MTLLRAVRPDDQDALRENGDAKPRPQRKWRQNKDFRAGALFDRPA